MPIDFEAFAREIALAWADDEGAYWVDLNFEGEKKAIIEKWLNGAA